VNVKNVRRILENVGVRRCRGLFQVDSRVYFLCKREREKGVRKKKKKDQEQASEFAAFLGIQLLALISVYSGFYTLDFTHKALIFTFMRFRISRDFSRLYLTRAIKWT